MVFSKFEVSSSLSPSSPPRPCVRRSSLSRSSHVGPQRRASRHWSVIAVVVVVIVAICLEVVHGRDGHEKIAMLFMGEMDENSFSSGARPAIRSIGRYDYDGERDRKIGGEKGGWRHCDFTAISRPTCLSRAVLSGFPLSIHPSVVSTILFVRHSFLFFLLHHHPRPQPLSLSVPFYHVFLPSCPFSLLVRHSFSIARLANKLQALEAQESQVTHGSCFKKQLSSNPSRCIFFRVKLNVMSPLFPLCRPAC